MSQDVDGEAMEDYQDNSEQEALEVEDGVELDDETREPGAEMSQTSRGINLLRDVDEEAVDDVEEEAHDGGDEVVMDAGAKESEESQTLVEAKNKHRLECHQRSAGHGKDLACRIIERSLYFQDVWI